MKKAPQPAPKTRKAPATKPYKMEARNNDDPPILASLPEGAKKITPENYRTLAEGIEIELTHVIKRIQHIRRLAVAVRDQENHTGLDRRLLDLSWSADFAIDNLFQASETSQEIATIAGKILSRAESGSEPAELILSPDSVVDPALSDFAQDLM